jgi:hypothetical protein
VSCFFAINGEIRDQLWGVRERVNLSEMGKIRSANEKRLLV